MTHTVPQSKKMLKHLIGEKCTAVVQVFGKDYNCLLDTGSQVKQLHSHSITTISLTNPYNLLTNCLQLRDLGYIEVCIKFPKEFIYSEPKIYTLALVVPDVSSSSEVPLLIGTNTLDAINEQCSNQSNMQSSSTLYGYNQVWRVLNKRKKQVASGKLSPVKLKGRTNEVLAAGQKTIVEGYMVQSALVGSETWALLEQPSESVLPGGVFVDNCLISLKKQSLQSTSLLEE